MFDKMIKKHNRNFVKGPTLFFSPVKLRMMGDYIEHTGGSSISCLLDVGVYATTSKSKDLKIKFIDDTVKNHVVEVNYHSLVINDFKTLTNLFSIIINEFLIRGHKLNTGVEGVMSPNISEFSGIDLEESYSFLLVKILNDFNFLSLDNNELIDICDKTHLIYNNLHLVENKFNLNLFNSKPNIAMLLTPETNFHEFIDVNFESFNIVIIYDKEIKEEVTYLIKERINDSISAHMIVDSKFKHKNLSDFSIHELNEVKDEVRDFEFKRIRHAITENNRVHELFNAFKEDDIIKVGNLFSLSQNSLLQDYEISNKRQDTLCRLVAKYNSLGSKMIASKYNNSIFVLIKDLQVPNLVRQVSKEYKENFGNDLEFVIANIYKGI